MEDTERSDSSDGNRSPVAMSWIARTVLHERISRWLEKCQPGVMVMGEGGQGDSDGRSSLNFNSTVGIPGSAGDALALLPPDVTQVSEAQSLIQKKEDHWETGSSGLAVLNEQIQKLSQLKEEAENLLQNNKEEFGPPAIKMLEQLKELLTTHQAGIESAKSLLTTTATAEPRDFNEAERRFLQCRAREEGFAQARLKAIEATVEARVKAAEVAEATAIAAEAALEARFQKVQGAYRVIRAQSGGPQLSKELAGQELKLKQEAKRSAELEQSLIERDLALRFQAVDISNEAELLKEQAFGLKVREDELLLVQRNLSQMQKKAGRVAECLESFFAAHQFPLPRNQIQDKKVQAEGTQGIANEALKGISSPVSQFKRKPEASSLHLAVENNDLDLVWSLLESGCDPSFRNANNLPAYNCAKTKECRTVFRKFRAKFPRKYNYIKAQLPGPLPSFLTAEEEEDLAETKRLISSCKKGSAMERPGTWRFGLPLGPCFQCKGHDPRRRGPLLGYRGKAFCRMDCLLDYYWWNCPRN